MPVGSACETERVAQYLLEVGSNGNKLAVLDSFILKT